MTQLLYPHYDYKFTITHVRDGDSFKGVLDFGFNEFKGDPMSDDHRDLIECRQFGYDAQEITRSASKGRGDKEVAQGYDHRDIFMDFLGVDPTNIPRKSAFHAIPPTEVVIQTIKDETGKYGRLLTIVHFQGENVNEKMRDIVGGVQFYDGKSYPANHPITPDSP